MGCQTTAALTATPSRFLRDCQSTQRAVAAPCQVGQSPPRNRLDQDFQDYAFDEWIYTADEIRAQMDGAAEAGGRGWLRWDPAVKYTRAALVSAQPSYRTQSGWFVPVLRDRDINKAGQPGQRTPDAFRDDLIGCSLLATIRSRWQMVEERLSMVPEATFVVPTFDGALSPIRLLPDGSVDPESAVGIMKTLFTIATLSRSAAGRTFCIVPVAWSRGRSGFRPDGIGYNASWTC